MTAVVLSRKFLTVALVLVLIGGVLAAVRASGHSARTMVVGYFDNSTALFPGDDVRILGVPVGKVDRIEPQPDRVKIWFWFDSDVKVPAEVNAVIMSPQ